MVIALIIAVVAGGTLSYSAGDALPGDALYSVKTEVNERVTSWFRLSEKAKAAFEAELAARRMDEAARLAAEGKLNAKTRSQIQTKFQKHAAKAKKRAAALKASGDAKAAAEVNAEFAALLKSRAARLRIVASEKRDASAEIAPILESLIIKADEAAEASAEIKEGEPISDSGSEGGTGSSTEISKEIQTNFGALVLAYKNGKATLKGRLLRLTPCVNWEGSSAGAGGTAPSTIEFNLKMRSTAEVCIQVVSVPQDIEISSDATASSSYRVTVENVTVFTGTVQ